jgi:site-specific DNA recombinase
VKSAFGYCRVSSTGQADESKDGIPRQKEAIKRYAAANGFTIEQWFCDTITGKVEERPALEEMMIALHGNGVKIVVIERLDRLARKLTTQEAIIARLQRYKYVLISALEPDLIPEDDDDMESAMRVAMRQMLGIFAELDRKSIKYKLRAGRRRARANGRCEGQKPFGHYEGEQATIERIKALHAEGLPVSAICKALNDEGIVPRSGKKGWYPQQILKLLRKVSKQSPAS